MESTKLLLEAIALKKCVQATYNRMQLKLAPYILYTRHDELHLDAATVTRDGQPPREMKLGTFKLTGLRDVTLSADEFQPQLPVDLHDPKYAGVTLFAIER